MRKVRLPVCILLIACMLLAGCASTLQAENKKQTFRILGHDVTGFFTGTLEQKIPVGVGTFTAQDGTWTYTGTFAAASGAAKTESLEEMLAEGEGNAASQGGTTQTGSSAKAYAEAKDGTLEGSFPLAVTVDGTPYYGTYSGEVRADQMAGTGKFTSTTASFAYEGEWVDGQPVGTGKVEDLIYRIRIQEREIDGVYSGELNNLLPNGVGRFHSLDNSLIYDGEWSGGAISGKGTLCDAEYTVHFPDVDRAGSFEGDVIDGVPEGTGVFTATNDAGERYFYTGDWKNGTFEGLGTCTYENANYKVEDGHFSNGMYTPDMYELARYLGSGNADLSYQVSKPAESFLKSHADLFPSEQADSLEAYLNRELDHKMIVKSPEKYGDEVVCFDNMQVVQIWENPVYQHESFTTMLLVDKATYKDYVYAFYPSELPDTYENDTVTLYGIPLNASSYHTAAGGTNDCLILFVAYAEKQ